MLTFHASTPLQKTRRFKPTPYGGTSIIRPIQCSTNRFFLCKLTIWLDFDKPICYLA